MAAESKLQELTLIWYFKFSSVEKLTRGLPGVLSPPNSHTPHSPLPTTRTVVLVTRGYELDPKSMRQWR